MITARSLALTKVKFNISMRDGIKEVGAFTHNSGLFLHKQSRSNWVVSHHSGFRVFAVSTKRDAAIIMEQLYALMDWTKNKDEVLSSHREIRDEYYKLIRSYGGY